MAQMTNMGCGSLWAANSITSVLLGFLNRNKQQEINAENRRFQERMRKLSNASQEDKTHEEIKFRRHIMDLGRKYQQEASAAQFNTKNQAYQLEHFLSACWPLSPKLPQIILDKAKTAENGVPQELNVILLHTPLLPVKYGRLVNDEDAQIYAKIERDLLHDDISIIGNVEFLEGAFEKNIDVRGGNSNIMNIHFLMNQIPTLIISPQFDSLNKQIRFSIAVWEPQASRPLILPVFKIDHDPELLANNNDDLNLAIDKIHTAIAIITGATRDSYVMLTRHGEPTLAKLLNDPDHNYMKNLVLDSMPEVHNYIVNEYNNIIESLDANKQPDVLKAYHPEDIRRIENSVRNIIEL